MEKAVTWRKATRSAANGGCVNVAFSADGRMAGMIRDSKSPERGHLTTTVEAFTALLASVKAGELDV